MGRNTNRKRNTKTKPDPNSNKTWKREMNLSKYPEEARNKLLPQIIKHQRYFNHYYTWLQQIAYQLYVHGGFPEDVEKQIPKYMIEPMVHEKGILGVNKSAKHGWVTTSGTSGGLGTYLYPTDFRSTEKPFEYNSFPVYYYGRYKFENSGLLLKNKLSPFTTRSDLSSLQSFSFYAEQLAFIKQISDINLNAQKTPIIIAIDEDILLGDMQDLYDQYDGNMPVIYSRKLLNEKGQQKTSQLFENMKVLKTDAPFIVDKLETQKQKVWDEAMGNFGLMNMAQYKKERMTSHESQANMEQVEAMNNSNLMARQEFHDLAHELWGWNSWVKPSNKIFTTPDGSEYKMVGEENVNDKEKQ